MRSCRIRGTLLRSSSRADEGGNLVFRKSARNFNQVMANASSMTVAEVEEIVPTGKIGADAIHLPGIYVKKLVLRDAYPKHIEFRTTRPRQPPASAPRSANP